MAPAGWMGFLVLSLVAPPPGRTVAARPTIVWHDLADSGIADRRVLAEAARLLGQAGIHLAWRRGVAGGLLHPGEVPAILLDRDRSARPGGSRVLGACLANGRASGLWLYLENVRWVLGLRDGPLSAAERDGVARALGRVLAHELVHVLHPALGHASTGLMSAALSRSQLLGSDIEIDPDTRRALLPRGARSASAASAGAPSP